MMKSRGVGEIKGTETEEQLMLNARMRSDVFVVNPERWRVWGRRSVSEIGSFLIYAQGKSKMRLPGLWINKQEKTPKVCSEPSHLLRFKRGQGPWVQSP